MRRVRQWRQKEAEESGGGKSVVNKASDDVGGVGVGEDVLSACSSWLDPGAANLRSDANVRVLRMA
jgi:hypothetical protein